MIKNFFMFSPILDSYGSINKDSFQKESGWLFMLYSSFFTFNNGYILVQEDEKDLNMVTISVIFPGDEDEETDQDAILKMSRKNYEYIANKFEKVDKQKPKYFVLSYDDNGWIDLEIKNELSEQDLEYIDVEKQEKLESAK